MSAVCTSPHVLPKFSVLIRGPERRVLARVYGDTEAQAWQGACEVALAVADLRGLQVVRDRSAAEVQLCTSAR